MILRSEDEEFAAIRPANDDAQKSNSLEGECMRPSQVSKHLVDKVSSQAQANGAKRRAQRYHRNAPK
jgi:hypothetical protein